jgi:hypothetical protein
MNAPRRYLIEFVAITLAAGLAVRLPMVGLPTGLMLVAVVRAWLGGASMVGARAFGLTAFTGICLLSLAFSVPQSWLFTPRVTQTFNSVTYQSPRLGPVAWGWLVFAAWAMAAWRLQVEHRMRVNVAGGVLEREAAGVDSEDGDLEGVEGGV